MSEINARWEQSHRQHGRLAKYLVGCAVLLWPLSYLSGFEISWVGHQTWMTAFSVATFIGALGTTIGAAAFTGIVIFDDAPLPGSNY